MIHLCVGFQQVVSAEVARNSWEVKRWRHEVHSIGLLADMPRFVESRPEFHSIAKFLQQNRCVINEDVNDFGICPSAKLLESVRQLPVIHCDHWCDVPWQELIDEIAVVIYSSLVDLIRESTWQDSRPRDREAVNVYSELLNHIDITLPLPIVSWKSQLCVNYWSDQTAYPSRSWSWKYGNQSALKVKLMARQLSDNHNLQLSRLSD